MWSKLTTMEYRVITSSSPEGLSVIVNTKLNEGWEIVGSHQVIVVHSQNSFRGDQHMDTRNETEYSQTMVMKTKDTIEVDISFYHPDDNEDEKVYDEEGMREEFEYKLKQLI